SSRRSPPSTPSGWIRKATPGTCAASSSPAWPTCRAEMGETSPAVPRRFGRGVFLATVAGGVSSLLWGKAVWDQVSHAVSPVEALVPILPSGGWRIYTVSGSLPRFDERTWRLEVGGRVARPVSLSYRELRALPKAEQVSTFHCVTGWSVKNVHWGGGRLSDVLARAGLHSTGHALAV